MEPPKTNGDTKPRWDAWLQRAAWIAQIALVFAAIGGYFWTVRPIHQKQLLDEQIAERNVALRDATAELNQLNSKTSKLRIDNERLSKDSEEVYRQLRSNVILDLHSAESLCVTFDAAAFDPEQEVECVLKYAREHILATLREPDTSRLSTLLENHRQDLVRVTTTAAKQYSSRTKQLNESVRRMKAKIVKNADELVDDIQQHRQATGRSQAASLEDIEASGDPYEREAMFKHLLAADQLAARLHDQKVEQRNHDLSFGAAQADAIQSVLVKVIQEFRQ